MERLLIVAPSWVGDAVLATPALRAIRAGRPGADITLLARANPAAVLADAPWYDRLIAWPTGGNGRPIGAFKLARRLGGERFDAAVLFPNSFRSGLLAFLARARRRVGYARDARAVLLTDRLKPIKQGRTFVAESMLSYYARLAEAIGCAVDDHRLELFTSDADRRAVDELLAGNADQAPSLATGKNGPLIVLNPGGAFGPSKHWPAERFGQLADRLLERFGGRVVISGAPGERAIVERVASAMDRPAVRLTDSPIPLSAVRELVRRADLLVTNDTGPRHFAIAFGTPVVTLFGSTDPAWTATHCSGERSVRIELACSPCQKPLCPLEHHDCMRMMTVAMVESAAAELLESGFHG